jgi:hypothetical protein
MASMSAGAGCRSVVVVVLSVLGVLNACGIADKSRDDSAKATEEDPQAKAQQEAADNLARRTREQAAMAEKERQLMRQLGQARDQAGVQMAEAKARMEAAKAEAAKANSL